MHFMTVDITREWEALARDDGGRIVLVVTSDHSTPASMASHSWHPVPVLIRAANARADEASRFDEYACRSGGLGLRPGVHLLGLAMAHAGRLRKFGA